jgi:hypothetical protein
MSVYESPVELDAASNQDSQSGQCSGKKRALGINPAPLVNLSDDESRTDDEQTTNNKVANLAQ